MVPLVVIFAVSVMECVLGRPPTLAPLPMKDGCYLVSPEVMIFEMEGEAIILSFPMFWRVLKKRKIAPPTAKYIITKDNEAEDAPYQGEGRVQQHGKQLWLLPAQASDSGEYIGTYRNDTYCVTGSISLQVYKSSSADIKKWSYSISHPVGEDLKFSCPNLSDFNQTGRPIEWYKNSSLTSVQPDKPDSSFWDTGDLVIPAVKRYHAGLYTCHLRAVINNQQYKVSRAVLLCVEGPDPVITTTVHDPSKTSNQEPFSSSNSTVHTPVIRPPVIVSPLNGTIFESLHGLELICKVLTDCQMSDNTEVAWLANGKSVESSYLDGRALQGGKRVTRVSEGCQIELRLIVVAVTKEDLKTELKCITHNQEGRQEVVVKLQLEDSTFTWLVVAVVAVSCFLTVNSIFCYILCKPQRKKKMDYFLARQNSTF
ncbi:interleukin-1 receptor type 2 [Labrus bergylta]|uniref:interleukin-1 receptor type 2 n=1 Tax=Labrus bergylta TaxID=56723 RepID=UPI003313607E